MAKMHKCSKCGIAVDHESAIESYEEADEILCKEHLEDFRQEQAEVIKKAEEKLKKADECAKCGLPLAPKQIKATKGHTGEPLCQTHYAEYLKGKHLFPLNGDLSLVPDGFFKDANKETDEKRKREDAAKKAYEESQKKQETKASAPEKPAEETNNGALKCAECGVTLTKKQAKETELDAGRQLCKEHYGEYCTGEGRGPRGEDKTLVPKDWKLPAKPKADAAPKSKGPEKKQEAKHMKAEEPQECPQSPEEPEPIPSHEEAPESLPEALDEAPEGPEPEYMDEEEEPETENLSTEPRYVPEPEENREAEPVAQASIKSICGIVPQLCERGKIKIGGKGEQREKKGGGGRYGLPTKFDHFVITGMTKDETDNFAPDEEIMSLLPEKPTEIPITLLYDEPELNFRTSYARYKGGRCMCRGDGRIAFDEGMQQKVCNPEKCGHFQAAECKPNGVLTCLLTFAPRVGGVYKFRTTGWNSIRNIMSGLSFIYGLTGGRLRGLDLILTLTPKTVLVPKTNTRTVIYMVNVEFNGSIPQLLAKSEVATRALPPASEMALQAAELSARESPEECRDIEEEFYRK